MVNKEYSEAFAEIDEIFKIMPVDLLSKIPIEFRNTISKNKAKDYKIEIKEPLEEQKLKEETIVILGLIYRDFLSSPEEKEELKLKDSEELKKVEEELTKQYDINKVFEKRKKNNTTENQTTEMVVYKEQGFLKKIFNLIKGIFKRK